MEDLLTLYRIHSPSHNEYEMVEHLVNRLCEIGMTVYYDGFDNVYGEYGECETYPCIVAHMDEVHKNKPEDFEVVKYKGNYFGFSESTKSFVGIGADDKNGIWVALKVAVEFVKKKKPIKVVFFRAEERGCVGSANCEMDFFENCRFVLQCDRKGKSDFINKANGLELNSKEFREKAGEIYKRYGYSDACGLTTDVYELKERGLKVSAANISCGYYNPHTDEEMTSMVDLKNCLKMVLELMNIEETFPHEAQKQKYNSYYNGWGWYDRGYYNDGWQNNTTYNPKQQSTHDSDLKWGMDELRLH